MASHGHFGGGGRGWLNWGRSLHVPNLLEFDCQPIPNLLEFDCQLAEFTGYSKSNHDLIFPRWDSIGLVFRVHVTIQIFYCIR